MMTHAVSTNPADDKLWQAVLARDARGDGRFVYAVRSTGIYCRPSCPSRRPNRDSVRFFAGPDAAEIAGFRECRRCHPRAGVAPAPGLDHVRKAAAFIASHADEPITLAQLAAHVRTSPFHLQRTFTRILGISPRAYQDALRAQRFRRDLRTGKPLTGAMYDAGYGSSSRVYEQQPTGTRHDAGRNIGAARRARRSRSRSSIPRSAACSSRAPRKGCAR